MNESKKVSRLSAYWPSTTESVKEIKDLWSRLELKAVSKMKKVSATAVPEKLEEASQ